LKPISAGSAAKILTPHSKFLIITHRSPDGDTIGAGFALYYALRSLKKAVRVVNSDELPKRFSYLYGDYTEKEFKSEYVIAVDTADTKLFGDALQNYADKVNLCIDHHHGNSGYADYLLLDSNAAAACESVYEVIKAMDVEITPIIADCLYTGIATDTGCFRFSGTTANTLRIAAELIECGANFTDINHRLFETKTKTRVKLEQYTIKNTEYYLDSRCAFAAITKTAADEMKVTDDDYDGLAALTTEVEGVEVGLLVKEKEVGQFRISLRSSGRINVSAIAETFGGGGHIQAAGCSIEGRIDEVRMKLLKAVADAMGIALFLV
jgi:phosphoesterase RecJ-like protein